MESSYNVLRSLPLPGEDRSGVTVWQGRSIPASLRGMDQSKSVWLCLEAFFAPVMEYSGLIGVRERESSTTSCDATPEWARLILFRRLYLVSRSFCRRHAVANLQLGVRSFTEDAIEEAVAILLGLTEVDE